MEEHADDEKEKLVSSKKKKKGKLVSLGQINSISVAEDSRVLMKHLPTSSAEKTTKTTEIIGRGGSKSQGGLNEFALSLSNCWAGTTSWCATIGFCSNMLSLKLSKPLLQPQGPHSVGLAIAGMSSFTMFVSAVSFMQVVGARFTRMQITVMLVAFCIMLLA